MSEVTFVVWYDVEDESKKAVLYSTAAVRNLIAAHPSWKFRRVEQIRQECSDVSREFLPTTAA